jgi:hypothetical protein
VASPPGVHPLPVPADPGPTSCTATTPRSSKSSRTGPAARWCICPRPALTLMRPGAHPGRHRAQPDPRRRVPGLRFHGKARGASIRADLIDVAARIARHGRGHLTLHLPGGWHREDDWLALFRGRLRAARPGCLTSPDQVTPSQRPHGPRHADSRPASPGHAAEPVSGSTVTPARKHQDHVDRRNPRKRSPEVRRWIEV